MSNFQNEALPVSNSGVRKPQFPNRNASTFNPLSFNPEGHTSLEESERLRKKEKQALYRDQLDQMMAIKQEKKGIEKTAGEEYGHIGHREVDVDRERRELEQRYLQMQQEAELAQMQDQYKRANDYERYQQPEYNQAPQKAYSEINKYAEKGPDQESTFSQQDNLRDVLLNKIKSGYNHPSGAVYSTYQKVMDEKEKNRQDFERNVIDKAAREKQVKEEMRAMSEWDNKKKMQMEMHEANRRAVEAKQVEKRKQKAQEDALERQRMQDSLSQFEREDYMQKERMKRLREENNKVLSQQMKDVSTKKQDKGENVGQPRYESQDSIDQLYYQRNDREVKSPLEPSYAKMNQGPPLSGAGGRKQYAMDNITSQMGNLSIKAPFATDEEYSQNPKQDYASAQYYGDYMGGQEKYQNNPGQQGNLKSEYQKNIERARYGGYNIITNEYR